MGASRRGSRHSGKPAVVVPAATPKYIISRVVTSPRPERRGGDIGAKLSYPRSELVPDVPAITHGSQLNATNTGIPAGVSLTNFTSSVTINASWITNSNGGSRTLTARNFTSGTIIHIAANNFTFQSCKKTGAGGIWIDEPYTGTKFLDCEIDGNHENFQSSTAITGSNYEAKRCHFWRWPRNMFIGGGDVHIEECYMHDLTIDGSGSHVENIYVAGGANHVYIRNKLISNLTYLAYWAVGISASLAIYNESWAAFARLDGLVIQDNYMEGDGAYTGYFGALSAKRNPPLGEYAQNMVVSGNIFGRQESRFSSVYGPASGFDESGVGNSWTNNTWGSNGPFFVSGDPAAGSLVAAPGIN